MHRSKCHLAGLMAMLLCLLCTAGTALADGYSPATAEASAKRMVDLKLLTGTPDGNLNLGASITRAEFVTMMVRAYGQEGTAKAVRGAPTGFQDVAPDAWYSGYVAVAKNLVAQNGHKLGVNAEGTEFSPNQGLTAAEAVAFLMKFLGVQANSTLPWPDSYLSVAVEKGIITPADRAQITTLNGAATRGLIFYLSDQAFYNYTGSNGKTIYATYSDTTPPELSVTPPPPTTTEAKATVAGRVKDATALYNGTQQVSFQTDGSFSLEWPLTDGVNRLTLTAVDRAGNKTSQTVSITRLPQIVLRAINASLAGEGKVPVDHTAELSVTFTENDKEIAALPFTVTVDPALGSYDQATGLFKAGRTAGKGVIIVQAEGGLRAEVPVEVFNGLSLISVSPSNITVVPGQEIQLTAQGMDYLGNPVEIGEVTWSVIPAGVKIDQTGKIQIPAGRGLIVVNATAGGKTGAAFLRLSDAPITIEAQVPSQVTVGQKVHIPISVLQDGQALDLPVQVHTELGTWDSATQTLTITRAPGKGNLIISAGEQAVEYWIEIVAE